MFKKGVIVGNILRFYRFSNIGMPKIICPFHLRNFFVSVYPTSKVKIEGNVVDQYGYMYVLFTNIVFIIYVNTEYVFGLGVAIEITKLHIINHLTGKNNTIL